MESFATRLRTAMNARHLRQVDIVRAAQASGVKLGKSHISQYVSGKTTPRADTLRFLADTLQVDEQWQQGDIVVFDHVKHIGVISDKRDADGFSYVLHNMNQRQRENDYLAFSRRMGVTGHYRWDASRVPKSVLRAWKG